jgi:hypothetical protein
MERYRPNVCNSKTLPLHYCIVKNSGLRHFSLRCGRMNKLYLIKGVRYSRVLGTLFLCSGNIAYNVCAQAHRVKRGKLTRSLVSMVTARGSNSGKCSVHTEGVAARQPVRSLICTVLWDLRMNFMHSSNRHVCECSQPTRITFNSHVYRLQVHLRFSQLNTVPPCLSSEGGVICPTNLGDTADYGGGEEVTLLFYYTTPHATQLLITNHHICQMHINERWIVLLRPKQIYKAQVRCLQNTVYCVQLAGNNQGTYIF